MFKYVMSVFVISLICTSPSLADPNKSAPKYPTPECSKDLSPYVELESVLKVPSDYIDKCITTSGYIDTTTQTFSLENDSLSRLP
jgi:hypothetical protein